MTKLPLTTITMIASCRTRICVDSLREGSRFLAANTKPAWYPDSAGAVVREKCRKVGETAA